RFGGLPQVGESRPLRQNQEKAPLVGAFFLYIVTGVLPLRGARFGTRSESLASDSAACRRQASPVRSASNKMLVYGLRAPGIPPDDRALASTPVQKTRSFEKSRLTVLTALRIDTTAILMNGY
ncbi:MAG: hypothetical protein QFF03_16555, partial [Pseudomonadota bacterium]|nr:hypothetical protein [Pseudomonadota bacterium]